MATGDDEGEGGGEGGGVLFDLVNSVAVWLLSLVQAALLYVEGLFAWAMDWIGYRAWGAVTNFLGGVANFVNTFDRPDIFQTIEVKWCGGVSTLSQYSFGLDFTGPVSLVVAAVVFGFLIRLIPGI